MGLYKAIEKDQKSKITDGEYYGNMIVLLLIFLIGSTVLSYIAMFILYLLLMCLNLLGII